MDARQPSRDDDHAHDHGVSRRRLFTGGAAVAGGVLAATATSASAAAWGRRRRVVDLTHRLRKSFPTFDGAQPTDEVVYEELNHVLAVSRGGLAMPAVIVGNEPEGILKGSDLGLPHLLVEGKSMDEDNGGFS